MFHNNPDDKEDLVSAVAYWRADCLLSTHQLVNGLFVPFEQVASGNVAGYGFVNRISLNILAFGARSIVLCAADVRTDLIASLEAFFTFGTADCRFRRWRRR